MKRKAKAYWEGTGKEGSGHLSTNSGVLHETQYSFSTRFEDGIGTNPEELIAAAHAGCFTMKLSFNLSDGGYVPKEIDTDCIITFKDGAITNSHLVVSAQVDDVSDEEFAKFVKDAEENCPISKLLNTEITVEYVLNE
jgi:osmotically inducible protein OsmC